VRRPSTCLVRQDDVLLVHARRPSPCSSVLHAASETVPRTSSRRVGRCCDRRRPLPRSPWAPTGSLLRSPSVTPPTPPLHRRLLRPPAPCRRRGVRPRRRSARIAVTATGSVDGVRPTVGHQGRARHPVGRRGPNIGPLLALCSARRIAPMSKPANRRPLLQLSFLPMARVLLFA